MLPKKVLRAAGAILTVLLLVFAYRYIADLVTKADFSHTDIQWSWVAAAVVCFVAYYGLLSVHWLLACRMIDRKVPDAQYLAFLASQPYKYLPTSLFTFSYRAVYAKKLGLGVAKSSAAQMIEYASMLSANFFLFALLYGWTLDPRLSGLVLIVGGLAALWLVQTKSVSIKLKGKQLTIDTVRLVGMMLLAAAAWVLCGVAFVLVNHALGLPLHIVDFIAANSLAFSLSILAVFAPGGIGVREFVYGLFLVSSVAIIYWRIITFVLDIFLGTVAIILTYTKKGRYAAKTSR